MRDRSGARFDAAIALCIGQSPTIVGIGRARVTGDGVHRYPNTEAWSLHLYFADARCRIGNDAFAIIPGSITLTPRGVASVYETHEDLGHIFVHFMPAHEDAPDASLPLHVRPGTGSEPIATAIVEALTVHRSNPLLATARIWDALIRLAHLSAPDRTAPGAHPAVERALTWIDLHLPDRCSLDELAREAGVSATHLNRLFAEVLGISPMRHLRERRLELAHYLLVATDLPVKEVAYQVGIPDVHAFNKLCKARFGRPPTRIRDCDEAKAHSTA